MRLLPRTRRGTWLLAAAAWLGGCVVVWQLLPGVPRVVVPRADAGVPHGFTADGRGVYGRAYGTFDPLRDYERAQFSPGPDGPFCVWDVQTGRRMVNWSEPDTVTVHREFPDFAAAIISDKDGPADQSACLLDLKTGRREPLPWPPPVAEESRLTAGGRYLVYVTGRSKPFVTYWWDRTSRQVVGAFPGLTPSAVAADGRWVTVESAGAGTDRKRISVREPASGRVTVQFDRPGAVESVWFSPDGGYLVVSGDRALQVAELPSGRLCPSSLPWTPLVEIVPGLRQAITDHWEGNRPLTRWDLTTGQPVGDCHTPPDVQPEHVRSDSPLIVFGSWRDTEALTPIRAFLTKVPVVGRILPADGKWFMIYDPATDGEVARIRPSNPWEVHLSPDGRTFVSASLDGQLEFWDVPPRKPLTWFAIAAGVWALPVAWLARRRTRRLVNAEW